MNYEKGREEIGGHYDDAGDGKMGYGGPQVFFLIHPLIILLIMRIIDYYPQGAEQQRTRRELNNSTQFQFPNQFR